MVPWLPSIRTTFAPPWRLELDYSFTSRQIWRSGPSILHVEFTTETAAEPASRLHPSLLVCPLPDAKMPYGQRSEESKEREQKG